MIQNGRDWDEEDGDSPDEASEWLRPVWADDDADLDAPPLRRPIRVHSLPRSVRTTSTADALLAPLANAAAALARLDAQAEAASPAVQQGLITRLAYAEAAGWLASQSITAHPVSLALRDRERVGRRELWLQHKALRPSRSIPAWEQDDAWLDADGIPTLGTWMREAGYSTHYFGKWHVSNPPEHSLKRYGFAGDRVFALRRGSTALA